MRIARVASPTGVAFAAVHGNGDDLTFAEIANDPNTTPWTDPTFTGTTWSPAEVRLLTPFLPPKIVCVGRNYADHAKELGNKIPEAPILFLKPNTAVIGPGAEIKLPPDSSRVDFEAELAVVIGTGGRDIPADRALSSVLGYTIANDVTARDQQQADVQWTRAKSHDTFCPLGPWIETRFDPANAPIRTELDGELHQNSNTSQMLNDIPTLIEYISAIMTLRPLDVILTGTPAGVAPMTPGQTVSITIGGLGTLTNPVGSR